LGKIYPNTISRKTEGDNKNTSSFSDYSGSKELPNKENFKKVIG